MKSLKNPTGHIVRWLQFLETCSLKVTHCPAFEHKIAVLSRNPCKPGMKQEGKYHRWKNALFWRCQSFKEIIWHCLVQIRLQQLSDPDMPFSIKTRKWQPYLKKSITKYFPAEDPLDSLQLPPNFCYYGVALFLLWCPIPFLLPIPIVIPPSLTFLHFLWTRGICTTGEDS